jgi:peptidoglycan hydrolase-like protein with peptidoglycan-binding domain
MSDAVQRANERIEAWRLGTTSMQYETGGRGAGTVSTGVGDPGGVSYGTYQLSSRQPDGRPGTICEYLGQSRYADRFEGLAPASPEFGRAWRELATSEPDFAHDQHEFIRRTHYDIQVERLKERGIDLSTRGPAVQDALWSTSVQYRGRTPGIVEQGLERAHGDRVDLSALTDAQIVTAIQTQKLDRNDAYFRSSPESTRNNIEKRIVRELDDLLVLARAEDIRRDPVKFEAVPASEALRIDNPLRERLGMPEHSARDNGSPTRRANEAAFADGMFNLGDRGIGVETLQRQLIQAGYTGKDGQPLKPDGDFGPNTKHAVEELQRAHGLQVDGKAGMDSLRALADELQNGRPAPKLPEPERAPGRFEDASLGTGPLFQSLRGHVQTMDRAMGRTPDEASDRVAAALCAECRANGLTRVDGVVLGQKGGSAQPGEYVFAYSGSSERPSDWVGVKTAEAVQTPVEQSLAKAEALQRQQTMEAQQMAQAQQPANDHPARAIG